MFRVLFICFILIFLPRNIYCGPFGTDMGDAKEKFKDLQSYSEPGIEGENFKTAFMPKRHSLFEQYILTFGTSGLARIICVSPIIKDDSYGLNAVKKYDTLKSQLSKKYGAPEAKEFLQPGSIWKNPNEFAASIEKKERVHFSQWNHIDKDNLNQISLGIISQGFNSLAVILEYRYNNFKDLENQKTKSEEDAL